MFDDEDQQIGPCLKSIFVRDDAATLQDCQQHALHRVAHDPAQFSAYHCVKYGAVKCLELWAQHRQWRDQEWTAEIMARPSYFYLHGGGGAQGVCSLAAKHGRVGMLRLLRAHGCPLDDAVCRDAATFGQIECLRYLRDDENCPWDAGVYAAAAAAGQIKALSFMHMSTHMAMSMHTSSSEQDCAWDTTTCRSAAAGGHLDCLMYAQANGCPWDADTCMAAVHGGHLACLKYAHERGCPWDERAVATLPSTLIRKKESEWLEGRIQCIQYLRENGYTWDCGPAVADWWSRSNRYHYYTCNRGAFF